MNPQKPYRFDAHFKASVDRSSEQWRHYCEARHYAIRVYRDINSSFGATAVSGALSRFRDQLSGVESKRGAEAKSDLDRDVRLILQQEFKVELGPAAAVTK